MTVLPINAGTVLPDRRRLMLRLAAVIALLAALALALSSLPGLGEVREEFAGSAPGWLVLAFALEAASCLAYVVTIRGVFCRRLPWRLSYEVGMAAQGTNVLLPSGGVGGLALVAWALRRTGMSTERLARRTVAFYLITSSMNFLTAALAGTALAVGLLASGGAPLTLTAVPAVLAITAMAGVLALPRLLVRLQSRPREGRWGKALTVGGAALGEGIGDARLLVRSGRLDVIVGAAAYMLLDVAALAAAFIALGALPPIGVLLLAYVLGQLGALIPIPGGVGGADGALIGMLVLFGTPLAAAAAAVLAYRAFQLGLPALLGALALLRLPGVLRRAADAGAACEQPAAAPAQRAPRRPVRVAPPQVSLG